MTSEKVNRFTFSIWRLSGGFSLGAEPEHEQGEGAGMGCFDIVCLRK